MYNSYSKILYLLIVVCVMQSCVGPAHPGVRTGPLGPRIVQPPVPYHRSEYEIPNEPNFVQPYNRYKKSKTNSAFGAIVRIIEFEYDISDTVRIMPRLTSGFDEGEMTGDFTIMLDQYELTYSHSNPEVREYVEELSYESTDNARDSRILYDPIGSVANRASKNETNKVINRSQLYNAARYFLEPDDVTLLLRSKTMHFTIHLQNCDIFIYPSREQIQIIKRNIQTHYSS